MVNQTYFIIQVFVEWGEQFLMHNKHSNLYDLVSEEAGAAQFVEESRALEVAQFFQKTAALRGVAVSYKLFKKSLDTVEVPLPKVDWLKDHEVTIEEEKKPETGGKSDKKQAKSDKVEVDIEVEG